MTGDILPAVEQNVSSSLDFEEFKRAVGIAQERNPSWRYGQTLFNVLYEHNPSLANRLRAGPDDPFYDDRLADRFLLVVERYLA